MPVAAESLTSKFVWRQALSENLAQQAIPVLDKDLEKLSNYVNEAQNDYEQDPGAQLHAHQLPIFVKKLHPQSNV